MRRSTRVLYALVLSGMLLAGCASQTNTPPAGMPVASPSVAVTIAATPRPSATGTFSDTAAPQTATPAPSATASPQPAAPEFAQMTRDGCCVQPYFSPDGSQVLYLDRPATDAPTGLYAVPVDQPLAQPELFTQRLGPFNRDMSLNAFLEGGRTVVERMSDGAQWPINNGGRRVLFAPDGAHIAWMVDEEVGNFDVRRSDIWLANVDGTSARRMATLYGGGVQAWLSDSAHMLVSGKANRADVTSTLSILTLADGSLRKLIDVERPRSILLSPDDRHIAYYVGQARDAAQNGMYTLDIAAEGATPQRQSFFGAYRWCSPTRLYYIPLNLSSPGNELWRLDVTDGQATQLIAATEDSPFKIGNGDWDVTRDGRRIVYLNARDRNIWLVTLPEAC